MTTVGLDEVFAEFDNLSRAGRAIVSRALYAGAGVIADAVKAATLALPTDTYWGHPWWGPRIVLTPEEKEELASLVGIAHFDDSDDGRTTSISFDGYITKEDHPDSQFGDVVPAPMIVRSIESGSSVRAKRPFVRSAARAALEKCKAEMIREGNLVIDESRAGGVKLGGY